MAQLKPVSFSTTQSVEDADLARRLALAQQLQQQSMSSEPIQQQGHIVTGPSWTQGMARLLNAYTAKRMQDQAIAEQTKLAGEREARSSADMSMLAQALQGRQATPGGLTEDASGNVTQAAPLPAQTPQQAVTQAIPMMSAQTMPVAFQALQAERTREDAQAARREDLQLKLTSEEKRAAEARASRESQERLALAERQAAQERQQRFLAAQSAENNKFRASESQRARDQQDKLAAENRAFREMMLKAQQQGKPLSEFQGKNVLFGARMASADKTLTELEDNISTSGLAAKQAVQGIPLVGGVMGAGANLMLSADQQKVEQAQRDFVNAVLRQESGAVINPSEFLNAQRQYFPQPGDKTDVIAQKKQNRKLAINAFKVLAGPGGEQIDTLLNTPTMPGQNPAGGPRAGGPIVVDY